MAYRVMGDPVDKTNTEIAPRSNYLQWPLWLQILFDWFAGGIFVVLFWIGILVLGIEASAAHYWLAFLVGGACGEIRLRLMYVEHRLDLR